MKISKRAREEAIEACLCRADQWTSGTAGEQPWQDPYGEHPTGLALEAWVALFGSRFSDVGDEWLEAAALLRDGWNPGDSVAVRR